MDKYEQYLICKERGHVGDGKGWMNDGKVQWFRCKYCGTQFGEKTEEVEKGAPIKPKTKQDI